MKKEIICTVCPRGCHITVEGEGEKEVVAETLRPGYYYGGEVLRPAMVKVKRIEG